MSEPNSGFLGKKFSCPGCQSNLKFRRAPKSLLQTCPNCRRKLRLQEQAFEASKDDMLRMAIESLVDWNEPTSQAYDYRTDPLLDRIVCSSENSWKFDQPWPSESHQLVFERAEVLFNPRDMRSITHNRQLFFDGKCRRVTVFRTGEVEQIQVSGHWWDFELHECKLGLLPRWVVRELNLIPKAKVFAARINCLEKTVRADNDFLDLFIDLAIEKPTEC